MRQAYTNNILALLESLTEDSSSEVAKKMADDFRARRIEKGLTRAAVSEQAGVAPANVARFEQKGLISLDNLIRLAMTMGYVSEIKNIFAEPKYSTMDELLTIRANSGKKKAYNGKRK